MLPLRLTRNVYLIYFARYMNYHLRHAEEISIFSTIKSAEGLREHHNWQKSRKPESYFR